MENAEPSKRRGRPAYTAALVIPAVLTKAFILIPIIATFATSIGLMVYGGFEAYYFMADLFESGGVSHDAKHGTVLFRAIENVDLFLLATVIQLI